MVENKKAVARKSWRRVQVSGIVQGVGFRPTVYRLALKHGLVG
ncbi:acylphosphatase, partial [Candidatus Sumerlaeota bacterium]|nr:acylphosphatase [Candidatus Sumerlaeota bacterium]